MRPQRVALSASHRLAVVTLAAFVAHCSRATPGSRDDAVRYDESIAVRVEGAHLSSYDLLVALNAGVDTNALVSPLTSLVHGALLACPEAQAASGPASIVLAFTTSEGRLQGVEHSGDAPPRPAEDCMLRQLNGRSLGTVGPSVTKMLLHLKAVAPDAALVGEGDHASP